MEENKKEVSETEKDELTSELLANVEEIQSEQSEKVTEEVKKNKKKKVKVEESIDEDKIFRKFKIRDIVFLAIMSACMILTGAVMPLAAQVPLFGIIQVCIGLQFTIFPVLGMLKVRKPGSLLLMSLFCGVVLVFMNWIMFFCLLVCALICEGLALLIFKGYKNDWASFFNGIIYFPLTLPFLYVYYAFIYNFTDEEGEAVKAFIGSDVGTAIGMSVAVIAICAIGATIAFVIYRELRKSGRIKK